MSKRSVSMADIAQHVGLSRSTVSFVINGRSDIAAVSPTIVKAMPPAPNHDDPDKYD